MELLTFDVADAESDRFICTMRMPYNPLFRIKLEDIADFIYQKRPTLKYKKIAIEIKTVIRSI